MAKPLDFARRRIHRERGRGDCAELHGRGAREALSLDDDLRGTAFWTFGWVDRSDLDVLRADIWLGVRLRLRFGRGAAAIEKPSRVVEIARIRRRRRRIRLTGSIALVVALLVEVRAQRLAASPV